MSNHSRLIVGLGKTGWSIARFLKNKGLDFRGMDTREHPSHIQYFKQSIPEALTHVGSIHPKWIQASNEIILSPGIDPSLIFSHIHDSKTIVCSDLDLFARACNAPIIAITGTNGKSTTTVLIEHLLVAAKKQVQTGGNLGTPALDLLRKTPPDFYLLELSSFQLSITQHLKTAVSVFLNFSPDHLDRHATLNQYLQAKQAIYKNCDIAIWNRDEPDTYPAYTANQIINFGSGFAFTKKEFGLINHDNQTWLTQGKHLLLNVDDLKIKGRHNHLNALAALSVVNTLTHCELDILLKALISFKGLPHRLEWVCENQNITWINDSKATNSHALKAALLSLPACSGKKTILIAGGIHKKNDILDTLIPFLKKHIKQFILIGQDAPLLATHFKKIAPIDFASTLQEAVQLASNYAISGDTILFSPACSSQDMFTDYEERGNCFKESVKLTLSLDKTL